MFPILTIIAFSLGQGDDNDVRVKVPAEPFECAHARSLHFDQTGRRLVCVTQRGDLLVWDNNSESPVVTRLEEKPGGQIFDRAPMARSLVLATLRWLFSITMGACKSGISRFREKRAEYHAAEDRGRRQRADRPVWFDVPTGNGGARIDAH